MQSLFSTTNAAPTAPRPHVIEVELRDLRQRFNSMDPSPFKDKDLDRDAEEVNARPKRVSPPEFSAAASRLCADCGLCCDGVLFHTVRLQPSDSAKALAALGLKLKRKRGQILLQQPCPAFECSRCSIYAARPERCRLFECRQLRRVAEGAITEAAARENILGAKRRVAELESLLARTGGSNPKQPLSRRCEQRLAEPPAGSAEGETEAVMARLRQQARELDVLLNADFRIVPKVADAEPGDGWPSDDPFGEPPKAAAVPDGTGDRAVPFYAAPDHRPPSAA